MNFYKIDTAYDISLDSIVVRIEFEDNLNIIGIDLIIKKTDSLEDISKNFQFIASEIRKLS